MRARGGAALSVKEVVGRPFAFASMGEKVEDFDQFHPDRLVTYSPEAQELGRTRMAEINAAHSTLRTLHFH